MTEPREPEALPEDESVQPSEPSPDTGAWYPVTPKPEEPTAEEPAPEEPTPESLPEEAGEEPAGRHEGQPADGAQPEPAIEPAPEEPTPEPVPEEPGEATPEPDEEASATEPTVVHPNPFAEPTVISQTERLTIADEPVSAPVAAPGEPAEAIFRPPSPVSPSQEPTQVEQLSDEERRLAAERAARRDARAAALAAPAPQPLVAPAPVVIHKRTNDKFWGSLGLFLLRIALAGIFAIRGLNILTDIPAAQTQFAKTILADVPPGPQVWAIITGVASLLISLALLLGLLTRVAGLGVALIGGGALALVYWGNWSPFVAGQPGFLGEYQLLLAVVGVLLLFIGGGGWSLDRSFRAGRERNKRERAAATE